jgi:hypothetical protein
MNLLNRAGDHSSDQLFFGGIDPLRRYQLPVA